MASDKLTIKQEKFAQGLFTSLTQREAYKQAYNAEGMTDKQIDEEACKLAANPKVSQRIEELVDRLAEKNMVTVENILIELGRVGFANGSDFAKVVEKSYMKPIVDKDGKKIGKEEVFYKAVETPITDGLEKNKLAAIAGIKSTRDGIEIKTNDKVKALELMGKHLGMYTDKTEVKSSVTVEIVDDTKIEQLMSKATDEEMDILARADAIMKELEKR